VPFLLTPNADYLGHDAREIRVHHPPVQGGIGAFGDEIENADSKSAHLRS
jgi:hypothetical protein